MANVQRTRAQCRRYRTTPGAIELYFHLLEQRLQGFFMVRVDV